MRITFKIATLGQHTCLLTPNVTRAKESCRTEKGKFDPKKLVKYLQAPGITPSSRDNEAVQVWAWEILNQYEKLCSQEPQDTTAKGNVAEKRLQEGKFAFVRLELQCKHGTYFYRVTSHLNAGTAFVSTERCAQEVAELLEKIAAAVAKGLGLVAVKNGGEQILKGAPRSGTMQN